MSSLVRCRVRKPFAYSLDGVRQRRAVFGEVDVPAELVPGLEGEGYVIVLEAKNAGPAPENKAIAHSPEDKRVDKGPRGLWYVYDGVKRVSKGFATEAEAREVA